MGSLTNVPLGMLAHSRPHPAGAACLFACFPELFALKLLVDVSCVQRVRLSNYFSREQGQHVPHRSPSIPWRLRMLSLEPCGALWNGPANAPRSGSQIVNVSWCNQIFSMGLQRLNMRSQERDKEFWILQERGSQASQSADWEEALVQSHCTRDESSVEHNDHPKVDGCHGDLPGANCTRTWCRAGPFRGHFLIIHMFSPGLLQQ